MAGTNLSSDSPISLEKSELDEVSEEERLFFEKGGTVREVAITSPEYKRIEYVAKQLTSESISNAVDETFEAVVNMAKADIKTNDELQLVLEEIDKKRIPKDYEVKSMSRIDPNDDREDLTGRVFPDEKLASKVEPLVKQRILQKIASTEDLVKQNSYNAVYHILEKRWG